MGFYRQEYWSEFPFPSLGDLPEPGIEPGSPALQADVLLSDPQESLRRNGVAIIVNKRLRNALLGCNLKNNRMISVPFQGKPLNITVFQVYALTDNSEEAEVDWFIEGLQDLLELTPLK